MTAQAGAVAALLPCPFDCGAKEAPIVGNDGFGGWTVYCAHCSACTHEMCDQAGAIAMWNRRPAAVSVEALKALVAGWRIDGVVSDKYADELTQLIKERNNG